MLLDAYICAFIMTCNQKKIIHLTVKHELPRQSKESLLFGSFENVRHFLRNQEEEFFY